MSANDAAPWHKASWDLFVQKRLPQLLGERLPLAGYRVKSTGTYTCDVKVVLQGKESEVEIDYKDIPQPDPDGVFEIDGESQVVPPVASHDRLETAEIRSVGEQAYDFIAAHLGEAPENLHWDAPLARTWLLLDAWVREFFDLNAYELEGKGPVYRSNWLARRTFLRRLSIPDRENVLAPGHFGRTCPFETPEGPNIGRILTIANGAEIRDGRLVVVDDRPEAALGLSASMIPFIEHSDANRLLMGANMMRQWMIPPDPEPADVQTGAEPDAPDFWCGRSLLTAFISWDANTFEDAVVISESCAQRLNFPHPVEPGDKLSNRHGAKGVVSCILPDDEMPHLTDGRPVELIYSVCGLPSRMNFGQVREAVMGRIAKAEGKPAVVSPYKAPDEAEIRARLTKAGFTKDGMETLTLKGRKLQRPSTVGWVYWGRTLHIVRNKIHASVDKSRCQGVGEIEYQALREAKAFETVREVFNTLATDRDDAERLATRLATGVVEQAGPPAPKFADLVRRLTAAGILAEFQDGKLRFRFERPQDATLKLVRPLPHPWLRQHTLAEVGELKDLPEFKTLVEANARLERMLDSQAPDPLAENAVGQLEARVNDLFEVLLTPSHLQFGVGDTLSFLRTPAHVQFASRFSFSGRTVIVPGPDLRIDQVGLAEEIAWTLFGPLVIRELGGEKEVRERSQRASKALDKIMERSWVVVYRAPTFSPTSFIAFRPVRHPDRVIRLHPLACEMMNADFDGDQAAVFLPITQAGQEEARDRLSVAAHLERDPDLIHLLPPRMDAVYGLAWLSLSTRGWGEIGKLVGAEVGRKDGIITRWTLINALQRIVEHEGGQKALETSERLMRLGFEVAKGMGASVSPFIGEDLDLPPQPEENDPDQWLAFAGEVEARLMSFRAYDDNNIGQVILMSKSGARGSVHQLRQYVGGSGVVPDVEGKLVPIPNGWRDGLTPEEVFARVFGARNGLARVQLEIRKKAEEVREISAPKGYGVLARARRAKRPGIVFARAADGEEEDPLVDDFSRLFVGMPVKR